MQIIYEDEENAFVFFDRDESPSELGFYPFKEDLRLALVLDPELDETWNGEEAYYESVATFQDLIYIGQQHKAFRDFESDESVFWYENIPYSSYYWPLS